MGQALSAMTQHEASGCLASGAESSWTGRGEGTAIAAGTVESDQSPLVTISLIGRGAFVECEAAVTRVLSTFELHGQPTPRPEQRFVAISLFFYAAQVNVNLPSRCLAPPLFRGVALADTGW